MRYELNSRGNDCIDEALAPYEEFEALMRDTINKINELAKKHGVPDFDRFTKHKIELNDLAEAMETVCDNIDTARQCYNTQDIATGLADDLIEERRYRSAAE